jgi:hypothetical protein
MKNGYGRVLTNPDERKAQREANKTNQPVWYATGGGGGWWVLPTTSVKGKARNSVDAMNPAGGYAV